MRTFKLSLYKTLFAVITLLGLPLYMYGQVAADKYDLLKISNSEYKITSDATNTDYTYLNDGNSATQWNAGKIGTVNLYYTFNNEVNVKNIYFNLSDIETWDKPQYINVYIGTSENPIKRETVDRSLSAWTISLDESVSTKTLRLECVPNRPNEHTLIIPEISLEKQNSFYNDKTIQHK